MTNTDNKESWEEEFDEKFTTKPELESHEFPLANVLAKAVEVKAFIQEVEQKAIQRTLREERQFILNILDGIDISNKQMGIKDGTKAIRLCLSARYAGEIPLQEPTNKQ